MAPSSRGTFSTFISCQVHQQRLANHDKQLTKLLSSSKTMAKASQSLSSELKKVEQKESSLFSSISVLFANFHINVLFANFHSYHGRHQLSTNPPLTISQSTIHHLP